MENVNMRLSNNFKKEKIRINPQQNIITDKSLRDAKSKGLQSKYYLFNNPNLEITDNEDNLNSNIFLEKEPKNYIHLPIVSSKREECSLMTSPKDLKILENKFNNKFKNNFKNDYKNRNNKNSGKKNNNNNLNINSNQNNMMIDNVFFNSTRKSNPIQLNNEIYRYNNNNIINSIDRFNNNGFKEGAVNSSNNNLESNKIMDSEEESKNLIALEYNRPEAHKVNNKTNLDDINQYNNNDGYFQNSKIINNINNNKNNINYINERKKNELISYDYKIGNFNNLREKISINFTVEDPANIKEKNKNDSTNILKNEFTDNIKNLKNIKIPNTKPKLNSNYNEKGPVDNEMNNYNFINTRKIVQSQPEEKSNEPVDNYIYFNSSNKEANIPYSFQLNSKKDSEGQNNNFNKNLVVVLNNRYDKIINQDKSQTINFKNKKINQNDPIKYISNSRKIGSKLNQASIEIQSQLVDKPEEIPQDINNPIHYNKTAINIDNTKIYDSPILDNNRRHTNINNINNIYNINYDIVNPKLISPKSQDLLESNNEAIINNNVNNNNINNIDINMSPDERVLYQSATSDNKEEENLKDANDILRLSASHGFDENENKNIEQEINSPTEQNNPELQNRPNLEYEIGQKYDDSEPNEQIIIKQPISKNGYDSLSIQQKEQIKMNPEYEQTQEAQNKVKLINELQKKVIAQSELPKDKNSESYIVEKMGEQKPLTSEVKQYYQNNLMPMNIESIILHKKEYIKDSNSDSNTNLYKNEINKTNSKINNNVNKNEENENYANESIIKNEKNNSQGDQVFSIPLTTSKYPIEDNQFISNKESINNEQKDENYENNNNNIQNLDNNFEESENQNIINKNENNNNDYENDNNNNINDKYNNNNFEELKCKEFEDFSPDNWIRFYPKDERLFMFSKNDIIPNQMISKNSDTINEEIYQGDINKKGEKHGFGKYISPTMKRIGMWKNDKFTGWGREIRNNGDIYEGKFDNDKLNGKGVYKNKKNKNTYIGDFLNSNFNGKGELYTKNYHYQGDFINNRMNGNGRIEIYNQGEFEGTFKDDQFDGNGIMKWKNGKYYIGEVSKGQMNGYGEETFPDGTICKGNFVNGKMQGHGKVITPDGKVIEGEFKDGKIKNMIKK